MKSSAFWLQSPCFFMYVGCLFHFFRITENSLFFKFLFIHERQRYRQMEKQTSRGKPDVELHPRTPGSWSERKADAQPLSHSGAPENIVFLKRLIDHSFIHSFIHSFMRENEQEREHEGEEEGEVDSNEQGAQQRAGPQDHDLNWRQMLPRLSHPDALKIYSLNIIVLKCVFLYRIPFALRKFLYI